MFSEGLFTVAYHKWARLDTAVRDGFPAGFVAIIWAKTVDSSTDSIRVILEAKLAEIQKRPEFFQKRYRLFGRIAWIKSPYFVNKSQRGLNIFEVYFTQRK
jgi:hypothetical protein